MENSFLNNTPENNEQAPVTKEQVIEALKNNNEDATLLVRWTEQRLEGIETAPDSPERALKMINISLEDAAMYEEAGLYQEVFNRFNDAGQLANNYKMDELRSSIHDQLDAFEVRLDSYLDSLE